MRIAATGCQNIGKSTFVNDFLKEFPMYVKGKSYREFVKDNNQIILNEEGNAESQTLIRDALIDEAMKYKREDNVIHDRGVYDNLAYTLWLNYKGKGGVDNEYVNKTIPVIREAGKFYDIIIFFPMTSDYNIPLVQGDNLDRSLNEEFRVEIDAIMKSIFKTYTNQTGKFFDFRDCPAVIQMAGTREERISQVKLYLDPQSGNNITDSVLTPKD
jgi:hypothetical protein